MPKFLVYVDADAPYEVAAKNRVDATIDAMDKHRDAKRIAVKPKPEVAPVRMITGTRRVLHWHDGGAS